MAPVANFTAAITLAATKAANANAANALRTVMNQFVNLFKVVALDETVEAQRTVRNWLVPATATQAATPASGDAAQIQAVVELGVRVMYAAQTAQTDGRISSAQATAMLGVYNGSFGLF